MDSAISVSSAKANKEKQNIVNLKSEQKSGKDRNDTRKRMLLVCML